MAKIREVQVVSAEKVDTPFLLLEKEKFENNVARLRSRIEKFGVTLRPHLKTAKSIEAAKHILPDKSSPLTVSTLREAEAFAEAGYREILYAVGIVPQKLPRVVALLKKKVDIVVILDSVVQAEAINDASSQHDVTIPALIEIDCDGHRGGVLPESEELLSIGKILRDGDGEMRGVLAHAGESYNARNKKELIEAAENERRSIFSASQRLRNAGIPCSCCSVGSTPTAHFATSLEGITEVRAGVYVFFDLVMNGLGVCRVQDIALSVVASVIGKNNEKGWLFVDAGWMALSKDRGNEREHGKNGYGLVCDISGEVLEDVIVLDLNQEHGIIALRDGSEKSLPNIPIGTQLRILPNHACATAAQFSSYFVTSRNDHQRYMVWPRIAGW
ncbi:MAG: D-serine deaminase-like pyridoxal phosphate-dependent protein [Planctomycetota bacterium]|jgi:D-serine deaminase-like pyridoxal phosphate-dependent protein